MPDFGNRFWTLPVYDARTDQISELGLQYGTKPGFYIACGAELERRNPARHYRRDTLVHRLRRYQCRIAAQN